MAKESNNKSNKTKQQINEQTKQGYDRIRDDGPKSNQGKDRKRK